MIIKKRNLRGKVEKTEPKKVEAQVSDAQISEVENIEQQPVVEEIMKTSGSKKEVIEKACKKANMDSKKVEEQLKSIGLDI